MIPLSELKVGQKGIVSYIENIEVKRRFLEIGLVNGTFVECILESPFKSPKAYFIKGASIAIRKNDAFYVMVEVI